MAMKRAAVFLDKDGTLVVDVPYDPSPDRVQLAPGAGVAVRALNEAGFVVLVVSNQSGLARGRFTYGQLEESAERIVELLARDGARIDGWYWCPHHPEGSVAELAIECDCRKPQAGMLLRAADERAVDLESSWMVGDILNDVEAGARVGCRTALVDVGNETEWVDGPLRVPDVTCDSLLGAARHIVASVAPRSRLDPALPAGAQA